MRDNSTCRASITILDFCPTADSRWLLVEEGFNLAREHEIESIFSVSNGYVGTRGSLAEGSPLSAPATFIAGIFDINLHGSIPQLASAPDWMRLLGKISGEEFNLEEVNSLKHCRLLDLRQGILWREWRFQDRNGRISRINGLRLASLADRHLLMQTVLFIPENYSDRLHLKAWIEQPASRPGEVALAPVPTTRSREISNNSSIKVVEWVTHTGICIAFATATRLCVEESESNERTIELKRTLDTEAWEVDVELGKQYRLDRLITVYTSRDLAQPTSAAVQHLEKLLDQGIRKVIGKHVQAWKVRWRSADVEIEGDSEVQRALRFACYHLISTANPEDERVSIGARALTGLAYKGHVFWDTEIFMLPFYIFTDPPSARALLMYRYHTLPAAREKARRYGYRGALYAWESANSGEETTPPYAIAADGKVMRILTGEQEHHISADIAYGVWQYWQASGDDNFLLEAGAEIMIETARFWASRGRREEDGRYHIRKVIGPDEYHEDIEDDAYTNGMAQWNLERAVEMAHLLAKRWPERWKEVAEELSITEEEICTWAEIARQVYLDCHPQTGVIEQFQGYFLLEDIDLKHYTPRTLPIDVLLGRERTQQSRVIKQADVIMLIYLLWDRFTPAVREANFHYYEPRTGHGSSLSPPIHACVAARLGHRELAMHYFRQAAEIDLANNMGNAAGGVHAAALGGLWQAAILGFAGMHLAQDGLAFAPNCPPSWGALQFPVQWRGNYLRVLIEPATLKITVEGVSPVMIAVGDGPPVEVPPGRSKRWEQTQGAWKEVST
jgi:trehalose/maltose hydrolase-like predicted phosphorylase